MYNKKKNTMLKVKKIILFLIVSIIIAAGGISCKSQKRGKIPGGQRPPQERQDNMNQNQNNNNQMPNQYQGQ